MMLKRCEGETNIRYTNGKSGYKKCKNKVKNQMPGKGYFCKLHEKQNHHAEFIRLLEK